MATLHPLPCTEHSRRSPNPTAELLPIITGIWRTLSIEAAKTRPSESETMRTITVAVSDEAYRQARIGAAGQETSVSAVVRHLFESLPSNTGADSAFSVHNSSVTNYMRTPSTSIATSN